MKQPKRNNLTKDIVGTKKMKAQMAKSKKIKITINFDADILEEIKEMSEEMGTPYQTLLNKIVKDALKQKRTEEKRLDRLEAEIEKLKKIVA